MEIVIVKQTDAKLSEQDSEAVRRFLFQSVDGCNDADKKAWRSWWKAVAKAGSGEYFVISIKRTRSTQFHKLLMAVLNKVFQAQEVFDNFDVFRAVVKLGAGFATYIPDLDTGELKAIPKSQSFDECSEEQIRIFFDDMQKFLRSEKALGIFWPNLSPQVASQGIENLLSQFDQGMP